jgi:hypothetical protein
MLLNKFLPSENNNQEPLLSQQAINENEFSNFFFINKVFESLNTLKNEGNLQTKIQEKQKTKDSKNTFSSQNIIEEKDESESRNENSIQEEEQTTTCKVKMLSQ